MDEIIECKQDEIIECKQLMETTSKMDIKDFENMLKHSITLAIINQGTIDRITGSVSTLHDKMNTLSNDVDDLKVAAAQAEQRITEQIRAEIKAQKNEIRALSDFYEIRLCFEFIEKYGCNTTNGYVTYFPVHLSGKSCVSICLPLLNICMKKYYPALVSKHKLDIKTLMKWFVRLETIAVTSSDVDDTLMQLFGFRGYSTHRANYDSFVTFETAYFIKILEQLKNFPSVLMEPEKTLDRHKYTDGVKVMHSTVSKTDPALHHKMAWGCEVQREVLELQSVREFFQMLQQDVEEPTHFCGLHRLNTVSFPVNGHAALLGDIDEDTPLIKIKEKRTKEPKNKKRKLTEASC